MQFSIVTVLALAAVASAAPHSPVDGVTSLVAPVTNAAGAAPSNDQTATPSANNSNGPTTACTQSNGSSGTRMCCSTSGNNSANNQGGSTSTSTSTKDIMKQIDVSNVTEMLGFLGAFGWTQQALGKRTDTTPTDQTDATQSSGDASCTAQVSCADNQPNFCLADGSFNGNSLNLVPIVQSAKQPATADASQGDSSTSKSTAPAPVTPVVPRL